MPLLNLIKPTGRRRISQPRVNSLCCPVLQVIRRVGRGEVVPAFQGFLPSVRHPPTADFCIVTTETAVCWVHLKHPEFESLGVVDLESTL
jgi:hypothetical protein